VGGDVCPARLTSLQLWSVKYLMRFCVQPSKLCDNGQRNLAPEQSDNANN
jgi:hypothetical protein